MNQDSTGEDKAAQAREGLLDSVAGKAKELAGAVSGRGDLVEEGQLQQAEASNRRAAVADEAVADARSEEAGHELLESNREAERHQDAVRAASAREESEIAREQAADHAVAERSADVQEAHDRQAAEQEAEALAESRLRDAEAKQDEAASTERDASAQARRLEQEAAAADQQAARLRDQAED